MYRIITALFITVVIFNGMCVKAQGNRPLASSWEKVHAIWSAPNDSIQEALIWDSFEGYCRQGADSSEACGNLASLLPDLNRMPSASNAMHAYNAALYFLKQQQLEKARYWWALFLQMDTDSTCTSSWMALMLYDTVSASVPNQSVDWNACQSCWQLKPPSSNLRLEKWRKGSSYVLPGLGMFLKGYPKEALISFGLNAGAGYLVYNMFQRKLYWNSIGFASMFLFKFYSGNIRLSEKLVPRQRNRQYNKTADACRHRLRMAWDACPPEYR